MTFNDFDSFCLDASIFVKLLTPEDDSEQVSRFFIGIRQKAVVSPEFSKIEIVATLRKKYYLNQITKGQLADAVGLFKRIDVNYINNNWDVIEESLKIANDLSLTTIYDCIYLSIAKETSSAFITADIKFLEKAKTIYKHAYRVEDFL